MKKYKVIVSEEAKKDIKANVTYVKNILKNTGAANKLNVDLKKAVMSLSSMPERNPIIGLNDNPNRDFRRMILRNYNIFYSIDVDKAQVNIIRIFHSRRDWNRILNVGVDSWSNVVHEDIEPYDEYEKSVLIKASADLRNNYSEVSELCQNNHVIITKNGKEEVVLLSSEEFERLSSLI